MVDVEHVTNGVEEFDVTAVHLSEASDAQIEEAAEQLDCPEAALHLKRLRDCIAENR